MRILFIGDAWLGSNARSLANGFSSIGHEVIHINTSQINLPLKWSAPWVYSKFSGRRHPHIVERIHREIEDAYDAVRPDLVFGFKTVHLRQDRLTSLGRVPMIHYSADDVSNPYNTTPEYLQYERAWTTIVTTKKHNVIELRNRGVADPVFVQSAYDPAIHHPVARRTASQSLVGFLGNKRPDRQGLIQSLARRYGNLMKIGGPGWKKDPIVRSSGARIYGGLYGEEFSYFVASVQANLVLLNSDNRDTHTCRSFEVPAAGGLFVGQRTAEHEAMLVDGREAYMFESDDELASILDRIRANPADAASVARRGYDRIRAEKHTYADRAREILTQVPSR